MKAEIGGLRFNGRRVNAALSPWALASVAEASRKVQRSDVYSYADAPYGELHGGTPASAHLLVQPCSSYMQHAAPC